MEGLTTEEVVALAEFFADPLEARQFLVEAGLPGADLPWSTHSPRVFWTAVSDLLVAGVASDGRERLLALVRKRSPANGLLAGSRAGGSRGKAVAAGPGYWKVPIRPTLFVGREVLLAELAAMAAPTGHDMASVVALVGMGGVGKTALAAEFAHRQRHLFDVVWWIPAERAELVSGHLAALGERLGLPASTDPHGVFWELHLRHLRWLLVLDNAEDLAALDPLRHWDRLGRLLVTSRRAGWDSVGTTVKVPTLARTASVTLLAGRLTGADPQAADTTAELLGDLPLAVEQAAAFCGQSGTPLVDLARLLQERLDEAIELGTVADRAGVTVATLWETSTRQLGDNAPAALELLELLAVSAPEPLPLDLLDGRGDLLGEGPLARAVSDRMTWIRTVATLVSSGMADRDATAIWSHRLVQASTRRRMGQTRQHELSAVLLALLRADLPGGIDTHPADWPRWRVLLPHARAVLNRASSPLAPPRLARQAGPWRDSRERWWRRVVPFLVTEPSAPSALTDLEWLHVQAATYLQVQGQAAQAEPLARQALALVEAGHGRDHPAVADTLNGLAAALFTLGSDEVAPLLRRALAIDEAAYGPRHRAVARDLTNLGSAVRVLRTDPAAARPLLERALAITETVHGPDHPATATCLNNVAAALYDNGQAAEAAALYRRALSVTESACGPDHPDVAVCLHNLALALAKQGQRSTATTLMERALTISRNTLGENHPQSGAIEIHLGAAAKESSRFSTWLF
ncbi:tetratricopeptide repeat protein [Frankia sp. CNm7]|uniref:Tetratricopeptide repeat protein n=1 Tax=Frankia nepalensis TaxID=1836974 RepID=A0A937UKN4_9ACTN|nr:tetratricopeptide repeat protein [Frankia nepalensis]MBL7500886.1 tetratricopeptide repeat protein [Frankia nepalensis]MBL7509252.1 tetratricopeptide repeat protein [Frankia nepalensis]MBL7517289.1 tetratricopeptide repeat protein [Frankia nepalensis]MBL7626984.1 tetratricopeptide repeat protein [Frankia nepalensis]